MYDLVQTFEIKFDDAFWTSSKSFFTYKKNNEFEAKNLTQNSAIPAIVHQSRHKKSKLAH